MTERKRSYLRLKPSETAVFRASADIYAAMITANLVTPANEMEMMRKAASQAILMAEYVDEFVISDDEKDPDEKRAL